MKKTIVVFIVLIFILLNSCNNKKVLLIGIAEDETTNLKTITESLINGRNMAIQEINDSKLQYKLKLKIVDTANSPEKTANAFRTLCDNDNVDLLIGTPSITCSQIAKYIANNREKLFISEAFDETITKNVNNTILFNQNPFNVGRNSALYFFYILKKNKLAVFYDNTNLSFLSQLKGFNESSKTGITVYEESFEGRKEKYDFTSNFARLKGINPEVVFIFADSNIYSQILQTAREFLGNSVLFVLNDLPDKENIKNDIRYNNVYVVTTFFENKERYISSNFYKIYKSKFGNNPNFYNALGYDEIIFVKDLLNNNLNLSNLDFVNKLKEMKFDSDKYITGLKGFDSNLLAIKPIDILKITNGIISFAGEFYMEGN